jgi:hypothetical protein
MTSMSGEPAAMHAGRGGWLELLKAREVAASLAITSMWIAVGLASIWGSTLETRSVDGSSASIPSGVIVALFAFLGSWIVARYAFRQPR